MIVYNWTQRKLRIVCREAEKRQAGAEGAIDNYVGDRQKPKADKIRRETVGVAGEFAVADYLGCSEKLLDWWDVANGEQSRTGVYPPGADLPWLGVEVKTTENESQPMLIPHTTDIVAAKGWDFWFVTVRWSGGISTDWGGTVIRGRMSGTEATKPERRAARGGMATEQHELESVEAFLPWYF